MTRRRARSLARTVWALQRVYVAAEMLPAYSRGHLSDEWDRLLRALPLWWFRTGQIEQRVIDPAMRILDRKSRERRALADYLAGRWCGECRWGVVEDPTCCYKEAVR